MRSASVLLALVTDLAYLVTALLDSPSLRKMIRQWSEFRYRSSGPVYDHHVARAGDYGTPLSEALRALPDDPRRILDVSTGTGHAARAAMSRFPVARTYACDLSFSMLTRAHTAMERALLICCDSADLPFGRGVFDLVLLQNAPPALSELARVTAPGGWVILGFSSAAPLPRWFPAAVAGRLRTYGFRSVRWDRAGRGIFIVGQCDVFEDVA